MLSTLIQACLVASGQGAKKPPPYVGDVLVHHLSQHIDAMFGCLEDGKMMVFYLGIDGVTVKDGAAVSNGKGMFAGPLKTGTSREKDALVGALQGMPSAFRAQLDQIGIDVIVAAKISESGGKSHSIGIELRRADLVALRAPLN